MKKSPLYPYHKIAVVQGLKIEEAEIILGAMQHDPMRKWFAYDGFPESTQALVSVTTDPILLALIDEEPAGVGWLKDAKYHRVTGKPMSCMTGLLYVMPTYRFKYATLIAKALIHTVTDVLGFENLYATTHPDHLISRTMIVSLGFHHVGVLPGEARFNGESVDLELYSLRAPRSNRGEEWKTMEILKPS